MLLGMGERFCRLKCGSQAMLCVRFVQSLAQIFAGSRPKDLDPTWPSTTGGVVSS
jgi:hypothetical protein